MTSDERRALVRRLRDTDGLTFAAIGEKLGITAQAAASAYRYQPTGGRRGVRPTPINLDALSPVARIVWRGLIARGIHCRADATARGIDDTAIRSVTGAESPLVLTLAPILAVIRPGDKDGGWGWFGRQLAAERA